MGECQHNWVFQETNRKCTVTGYENYTAHFIRVDRYYCSKCCKINELEKKADVDLPFGGIRNTLAFAPVWYK